MLGRQTAGARTSSPLATSKFIVVASLWSRCDIAYVMPWQLFMRRWRTRKKIDGIDYCATILYDPPDLERLDVLQTENICLTN